MKVKLGVIVDSYSLTSMKPEKKEGYSVARSLWSISVGKEALLVHKDFQAVKNFLEFEENFIETSFVSTSTKFFGGNSL